MVKSYTTSKIFHIGNNRLAILFLFSLIMIFKTVDVIAQQTENIGVFVSPPEVMEFNLGSQYQPETEGFASLSGVNWAPLPNGYNSAIGTYFQTNGASQVQGDNQYGAGTGNYLSIGPDDVVTLQLNEPTRYFGFAWPAGDDGNEVEIRGNGVSLFTLRTSDILAFLPDDNTMRTSIGGDSFVTSAYYGKPAPPNSGQNMGEPYAYIHFIATEGLSFDEILFRHMDANGAFETDNHTITNPVPEIGDVPDLIQVFSQTPPIADNDESFGNSVGSPVTINAVSNDDDGFRQSEDIPGGSEIVPIDLASIVFDGDFPVGSVLSNNNQTLTVPGEGVWTTDTNGNVTFTPESYFLGDPTPVQYRISDTSGLASNIATITIGYTTTVTLTGGSCWRTLSSPIAGQTYQQFFHGFGNDGLWTQGEGITGARHSSGTPNVYTLNEEGDEWVPILDLTQPIPAGRGFLMTVFTDDDYGVEGSWDKLAAFNGVENEAVTVHLSNEPGQGDSGFAILGNPYKNRISFDKLDVNGIRNTFWIYDRNSSNWISWNGTTGDITDGIIDPFQGFVVRNNAAVMNPSVGFTSDSKINEQGAGFFGKKTESNPQFIRLEVEGQGLYNSAWLQFSDQGNNALTANDALQLASFDANFATLSSVKNDGTLLDIGHYPLPDDKLTIPIQLTATQNGPFIIRVTDLNLALGTELYLHDLKTDERLRITENTVYSFTFETPHKTASNSCLNMPSKAKYNDVPRFVITGKTPHNQVLPHAITLDQNYPNPFNPATNISYHLPENGYVSLEIFDLNGRRITSLVEGQVEAGSHQITFDASHLSSGVYVYRLQAGSVVLSRKFTLIK